MVSKQENHFLLPLASQTRLPLEASRCQRVQSVQFRASMMAHTVRRQTPSWRSDNAALSFDAIWVVQTIMYSRIGMIV